MRDIVVLNAAAALVVAGVADDLADGLSTPSRRSTTAGRRQRSKRWYARASRRRTRAPDGQGAAVHVVWCDHAIDALADGATFQCETCGQVMKVPPGLAGRGSSGRSPAPRRPRASEQPGRARAVRPRPRSRRRTHRRARGRCRRTAPPAPRRRPGSTARRRRSRNRAAVGGRTRPCSRPAILPRPDRRRRRPPRPGASAERPAPEELRATTAARRCLSGCASSSG